jgi:hypothetical protein
VFDLIKKRRPSNTRLGDSRVSRPTQRTTNLKLGLRWICCVFDLILPGNTRSADFRVSWVTNLMSGLHPDPLCVLLDHATVGKALAK